MGMQHPPNVKMTDSGIAEMLRKTVLRSDGDSASSFVKGFYDEMIPGKRVVIGREPNPSILAESIPRRVSLVWRSGGETEASPLTTAFFSDLQRGTV